MDTKQEDNRIPEESEIPKENEIPKESEISEEGGEETKEEMPFEKILEDAACDDKRNIYIQYRIIHNHGVMTGDDAKIESIEIKGTEKKKENPGQGNIFDDEGQLSSWLTENYEAYPMALMIAAAAFDSLPYMWVVQAADLLYQLFDRKGDEEEKKYGITDIFSRFGAKICQGEMNTYTGRMPIEVVQLEESGYQEKILKYIWKECPGLHDTIMRWLKNHSMKKPMSMSKRAVQMIGKLACWDYYYFLNNMIGRIHREKSISTDMMIAQTVLIVSREEVYRENICNLLHVWSRENRVHYILTALLVCAQQEDKKDILESMIDRYVCKSMEEIREGKEREYLPNLYDFFASGMRAFTFYRILVEKLYEQARDRMSPREKRDICELFLRLFAADISLARLEEGEDAILVKLCMVDHDISYKIRFLWQLLWQCRYYRQVFYRLMGQYDKRRDAKGSRTGYGLRKFIDRVLEDICTKAMRNDICEKIHRRAKSE